MNPPHCLAIIASLLLTLAGIAHADALQQHVSPMTAPLFAGYKTDPDTGFKVWRLGGSVEEMDSTRPYPKGRDNITLLHAQHFYSRTSPVNIKETHVLGSAGWHKPYAALWRLQDKQLVAWVPGPDPEANPTQRQLLWDRKTNNVYWFTQGNQLLRVSIDFKNFQTHIEEWDHFPQFTYITFGSGDGNFSDDGNKLLIVGEARDGSGTYLLPYDVPDKHAHPARHLAFRTDSASVDPSGKYVVFTQANPDEKTFVIPFLGAKSAKPRIILKDIKHCDLVLDPEGEPWMVYGDWKGLSAVKLADATSRRIWPEPSAYGEKGDPTNNASGHVARIAGRPGWVLLSRIYDGGLYLVDITGHGRPEYVGNSRHGRVPQAPADVPSAQRWGVTSYGAVTTYVREARAAASPSGHYLFFVSDYHVYSTPNGGYDPEPKPSKAFLNMIEYQPE